MVRTFTEDMAGEEQQSLLYQILYSSIRKRSDNIISGRFYEVLAPGTIEGRIDKFMRLDAGVIDIDFRFLTTTHYNESLYFNSETKELDD